MDAVIRLCRKLEAEMQNGCLIHFSGCQDFGFCRKLLQV